MTTKADWSNIRSTTDVCLSFADRVRVLFGARLRLILVQRVDVELPHPARVLSEQIIVGEPRAAVETREGEDGGDT